MLPLKLLTCAVDGNSMAPTLNDGDWIVAQQLRPDRMEIAKWKKIVNQIVIAKIDGLLQIKRVSQVEVSQSNQITLWLLGDNPEFSTDSRTYGWVSSEKIIAHYLLRYKRSKR